MFEKVIGVISKPPALRKDHEVDALLMWFRHKSKWFAKVKTEALKDIIRNCRYETYNRDDFIIKQGERGECFYIILGGEVAIYLYNKDKDGEEDGKDLEHIFQPDKDGNVDRGKLGNFATNLQQGSPFGEVALGSEDCIRTATILANEKTDLVRIDKSLYNRSMKDVLDSEFKEKTSFIRRSPLFSSWAPKYRKQLAMALYKEEFSYESMLVRQGEPVTNMYFILSGQVEIQIDPSSHLQQYPRTFAAAFSGAEKFLKRTNHVRPPTETQYNNNVKKKDSTKCTRLCYLGLNESVGEVEFLMDLDTYMQSAKCTERTEVMVLEMKHYERLFVRRHQRTIETMRDHLSVKLDTRISLLSHKDEVPLMTLIKDKLAARNRPPPPPERERTDLKSVSAAEKEFLNHKGPLIDMYGPGSVFYMIRVREQTKMKLRIKRQRLRREGGGIPGPGHHVHSVSLPQSLIMAAQKAGATKEDIDGILESSKGRPGSAKSKPDAPRSFRQIQSAYKIVEEEQEEENEDNPVQTTDTSESTESYPPSNGISTSFEREEHDAAMTILEARIKEWLTRDNPKAGRQVTQLRRLAAEDLETQPKPGNKVVIRRRRRPATTPLMEETSREHGSDRSSDYKILLAN